MCFFPFFVSLTTTFLSAQAHFAQLRTPGTMSPLTGMPGFHAGPPPSLAHQQLYFGQVGPGLIPQGPAYGFQQQHMPGLQPAIPSNFIMPFPLQRQGQPGQRLGPRAGSNSQQHQPQVCHFSRLVEFSSPTVCSWEIYNQSPLGFICIICLCL